MIKQDAINVIQALPDDVTWDEIMYYLYVNQKIDKGLADIDNSAVCSHEDARSRLIAHD